jgi:hypothetical protein
MALPTIAAGAGKWLWDKYAGELVKDLLGKAQGQLRERIQEKWATFNWNAAAVTYRERMIDAYGTTRIFGQPRPVPLGEIFTDVYILEQPAAFRRFDIRRLQASTGADPGLLEDGKRVHGRTLLRRRDAHRLFILGKPGAGKTTFLRHLALQAAQGRLDKIPVFVTLKDWSDSGKDILAFIAHEFAICGFPDATPFIKHLLEKTDDALVLFDGLDEVRQEGNQRADAISALRDFSRWYDRAQILVTCRNAATDYTFERFVYVEIADFTAAQMETFVRKWFSAVPAIADAFLDEIGEDAHRGLRELARTPLLLALLCLSFRDNLTFPARRVEIYHDALDALLRKWDSSRNIRRDEIYRRLSTGRKHQLFARIAAETFDQGDYFLAQEALEDQIAAYLSRLPRADAEPSADIDAEAVVKAIESQHGILVERAQRIYSFAHLTFQEYYTACYTVENAARGAVARLLAHCTDPRWREVILLTASLLDDADVFFARFLRVLHDLVGNTMGLVALLEWAARRGAIAQTEHHPAALRAYCCWVAFGRINPDPEHARFVVRSDGCPESGMLRAEAMIYAGNVSRLLAGDLGLDPIHDALSPPKEDPLFGIDPASVARYRQSMFNLRDFVFRWRFRPEAAKRVRGYFYGVQLLLECLDLAYVTGRAAIENRLLLPPGWDGESGQEEEKTP